MDVKLIIRDEVNCKLEGIAVEHRRALSNKFKVEVPGVRYSPAVRLGRWDGKISFFQLGGSTYINLLPDILPELENWNYNVEVEDLREYKTTFEFEQVTKETFANKTWPVGHQHAGEPIELRDYQIEHINLFLSNPQCLQEIATGAGKTLITATLSYQVEKYGRSIVIVPNKTLVEQTETDYRNLGLDVGVFFGDRKEYNKTHTICTWQSLGILFKKTKANDVDISIGEFIENVQCIIVDEVHSAKADVLRSLLSGAMSHIPIRWGLTGTIPKEAHDKLSLLCSLGSVVGSLGAKQLQDQGVLANCHVNIVQMVDYVTYRDYASELKYLVTDQNRVNWMGNLIKTISDSGNTLVLVDRLETGNKLIEVIPDSVFISGNTKSKDRKEEYAGIDTGTNKVIVATYGVAAVGINLVNLYNVVLIEPGKSFVRTIQSIGRGLRKGNDKDYVDIWDITSTCKFSKRHLTQRKNYYKEVQYNFSIEKIEWQ